MDAYTTSLGYPRVYKPKLGLDQLLHKYDLAKN